MFGAARDVKKLEDQLRAARLGGKTADARDLAKKLAVARARAGTESAVALTTLFPPTIL